MSEHPQGALQLLEREYERTIAVSRRRAAEAPEPHYHAEETAASQEISPEAAEGYVQLQNDSSDAEDAVDLEPHARATVGAKSDDDADADDGAGELEAGPQPAQRAHADAESVASPPGWTAELIEPMPTEHVDTIKRAMAGFTLKAPPWARHLSEQRSKPLPASAPQASSTPAAGLAATRSGSAHLPRTDPEISELRDELRTGLQTRLRSDR